LYIADVLTYETAKVTGMVSLDAGPYGKMWPRDFKDPRPTTKGFDAEAQHSYVVKWKVMTDVAAATFGCEGSVICVLLYKFQTRATFSQWLAALSDYII
jgi:hypothetical protein